APETVGAEEDTPRRRFELLKELAARCAATLKKKIHIVRRKKFLHRSCNLLHVAITREQHKCATFTLLQEMRDPMFERFLITRVARIGHFSDDEGFHLLLKIEGAAELQRLGFRCADARAKIREVRAAHGQSGTGHHATAVVAKEHP